MGKSTTSTIEPVAPDGTVMFKGRFYYHERLKQHAGMLVSLIDKRKTGSVSIIDSNDCCICIAEEVPTIMDTIEVPAPDLSGVKEHEPCLS